MLSREEQNKSVYDKATYYKAMIKNGWFMPHEKEAICTLKFMRKIRSEKIWCPKHN